MTRSVGTDPVWYREGLRFSCSGCGDCCRGDGFVWTNEVEVRRLAAFLDLEERDFEARYLRRVDGRLALVDRGGARASLRECVFWDNGCTVYEARPEQCRSWPFWPSNLSSPQSWRRVEAICPGAGEGRRYSEGEIVRISARGGETDVGPAEPACDRGKSRP